MAAARAPRRSEPARTAGRAAAAVVREVAVRERPRPEGYTRVRVMGMEMAELLLAGSVGRVAAALGLRLAWRARPGHSMTMERVRRIALDELLIPPRSYKRGLRELSEAGWITYRAPSGTSGGELIVEAVERSLPPGHRRARLRTQGEILLGL